MLVDQIEKDTIDSMKAKDENTLSVLRMLKAAITNFKIASKNDVTDQDVATIVQKEIKTRKESAEVYRQGNRPELAEKEEAEIEVLKKYLPLQLSEEEIRAKAKEAIAQSGATSIQDMGKVIGLLMAELKGKADGGTVSKIVKDELTK